MLQTLIFLHTTSTLQPPHDTFYLSCFSSSMHFTLSYDPLEWVSQIIIEDNVFQRVKLA
jgi:hypothetical protein